jgi:antitoxin FitA
MHASHMSKMIQVRNVPDGLHRRLKARAALSGMSLSEYLLQELRHAAARPTPAEVRARLEERTPVHPDETVVEAVRAERDAR